MATMQAGHVTTTSAVDHVGSVTQEEAPILTVKRAAKDIMFGSIAGMVAEIFEYPFDLAKVRLQAQLLTPPSSTAVHFDGPMHCLMQTWKDEGIRGLYRGLPAPIVGSMAETAALFVAYSAFQNVVRTFSPSSSGSSSAMPPPLSMSQLAVAAGGAGFVTSFVLTPIELVKCKMQVQMMNFHPPAAPGRIPRRSVPIIPPSSSSPPSSSIKGTQHTPASHTSHKPPCKTNNTGQTLRPPGPIALIRNIVDSYGVRGLWLGHTGTLVRETGGTAAWFVAKEFVARKLVERRIRQSPYLNSDRDVPRTHANTELLAWESALSGAIAGAVGALLVYPADTIKSAIQTEDELRPRSSSSAPGVRKTSTSSFLGTFRLMWAKHGVKGLYAGCGMTVARAVPSSGIIFVVYDGLTAYFA
ncbi:mitochondrial carrier domain-containing protein [Flammula alnicola]|nr:mitochondrial carrier domain-containing protein [Flammula alnicola]